MKKKIEIGDAFITCVFVILWAVSLVMFGDFCYMHTKPELIVGMAVLNGAVLFILSLHISSMVDAAPSDPHPEHTMD